MHALIPPRCPTLDPAAAPLPRRLPWLQVGLQSGAYDATLLVGDTRSAQPVQWSLGEVQVLHPPLDDGSQPEGAAYRCARRQCSAMQQAPALRFRVQRMGKAGLGPSSASLQLGGS